MEKKKAEELQSRREFFKNAAKAALPVVGAIIVTNVPTISKAEAPMGCDYSCLYGCDNTCNNGCYVSCSRGCKTSCTGTCDHSCMQTCIAQGANTY
ncbi:MAG: Cys-Xaa-Xaa-Xaa repeat radical SAM target protein [Bacteroidales bacterium]|nr:Cys-Xaa-Xaa-Xaa repeat radical SAM target protein [Bacteroidales bacterium]